MQVNPEQAKDHIFRCFKAGLTPMLSSSPGTGKSDIAKQIAKENSLELIDIRLSTIDPLDLTGALKIGENLATWIPMDIFPLTDTPIPKNKRGWLILLDEINSAPLSIQAASYRLILDREIGKYALHPNVALMAAGNLSTDGAIVNRMGTAMQSRLIHLKLSVDFKLWLEWGANNNMDHRILSYIQKNPDSLHKFDPKHNDKTFSCPRTWEFLSKLIKDVPTSGLQELLALMAGTIGEGAANQFLSYTSVYSNMPSYEDIIKDPVNARLDREPIMLMAVSHMIAAYCVIKDLDPVMEYVDRLPVEFQTITLQNICVRNPGIHKEKVINKWIGVNQINLDWR